MSSTRRFDDRQECLSYRCGDAIRFKSAPETILVKSPRDYIRRYLDGPMVRPLALSAPILVLLIALPLLRPLRHPGDASSDETLRLATVRALVEHRSLALDKSYEKIPGAMRTATGVYSSQPPMMALLLSTPAWVMNRMGFGFDENHLFITYMLTLLGVTLPVAGAAGLIYRMGRLFELKRAWRAALGFAVVAGSGLLSYAVVLNPHAPAATLVIGAAACLIHVAAMNRDDRRAGWFALAGACAALAATLDPVATVLLVLFMFVIPAMRFSLPRRVVGVMLYVVGAIPILSLHAAWNIPVTGDPLPASIHAVSRAPSDVESAAARPVAPDVVVVTASADEDVEFMDEESPRQSAWDEVGGHLLWLIKALVGEHGAVSHFPILILGMFGVGAVMHRHWPGSTKVLAAATSVGAVVILLLYAIAKLDWSGAMFATRWFIVFMPLLLFWSGAWLRRSHRPISWTLAGIALGFSVVVGLIGATDPTPRDGFERYTAADALMRLINSSRGQIDTGNALAGRAP
jgi:hypothetical protein